MNVRPIKPIAEAREFRPEEIFFSTTDLKGVILSGNDVFSRISGYSKAELYGEPHNIIRHPDMPRAAFYLLWANLKNGLPFAGYVKNMAKDGRFYWVFVLAVSAGPQRYLSVRFKPTTDLRQKVEGLYAAMLAAENEALKQGGKESDALAAGIQVAVAALGTLGFANYDSFSQLALSREMLARERHSPNTGVPAYDRVCRLFHQLEGLVESTLNLQKKAETVLQLAAEFRLHATNVNINAHRYAEAGRGLGVVAGFLGDCAVEMAKGTDALRQQIVAITKGTDVINTRISMAHLQMEMILFFQKEAALRQTTPDPEELKMLQECFEVSAREIGPALARLRDTLAPLTTCRDAINKIVLTIEMTQVLGNTETARIPNGDKLAAMFSLFREKMTGTRSHMDELSNVIQQITEITGGSAD